MSLTVYLFASIAGISYCFNALPVIGPIEATITSERNLSKNSSYTSELQFSQNLLSELNLISFPLIM